MGVCRTFSLLKTAFNGVSFVLCQTSLRAALLASVFLINPQVLAARTSSDLLNGSVKERGETHQLALPANQYVELRLHRTGDPILLVSLSRNSEEKVIETRTGRYEDLVLRLITDSGGQYALTVAPFEKQSIGTPYTLMLETARPATAKDLRIVKSDDAFREAERLRAQWNESALRAAIAKYAEAYAALQADTPHAEATIALLNIGEVHFILSEYKQAIEYFEQARRSSRAHGDRVREIEALNGIGYVHIYLSEYSRAIPYFDKAFALSRRVADPQRANAQQRLQATTLNNLGEAHYSLGDLKKSMDSFNKALALWEAAGDRRGQALAELNIGYTYYDMGDVEAATAHYEKSLPLWKVTDELRGEALTRTALGGIHSFVGERQLALDAHSEAMRVFTLIGDRQGQAAALNGLARVYEETNDLKTALDQYEQALRWYRQIGSREYEALTEMYVSRVYRAMNDLPAALKHAQQSISLCRAISNRRLQAYAQKVVGHIFHTQGQETKALKLLTDVLRLYSEIGDRRGQAQTLNVIGNIYQSTQRPAVAKTYFDRALLLNRAGDDRAGEAATRFNIARAERKLDRLTNAVAEIEAAMKIVESLRSSLARYELRYSYFALMQEYYAFYIDLLLQLHKQNSDQNLVALAFEASESTRARSLREILTEAKVDIREGISEELLARERSLQQQLNARAKYYLRLRNNQRTEAEASELEKQVRQLTNEYSEVEAQIRAQSPRYAELTQPELPNTKDIQTKLLDDETVLLEFFLGEEKSYLWLVSKTSLQVFELPNRAELEEATVKFYKLITARQPLPQEELAAYEKRVSEADAEYWKQAAVLSNVLLGPVASQISGKRLLLVTDGALHYVPFEALPEPDATKSDNANEPNPLILSHEIVSIPSASTLHSLRQKKPQSLTPDKLLAVFADPVFGDTDPRVKQKPHAVSAEPQQQAELVPVGISERDASSRSAIQRLPSTRLESEAIMEAVPRDQGVVATGFDASRSRVMHRDLARFQIVHFATHGVVNSEHPELSGIILSMVDQEGSPKDGFFQLHDIYNLKLAAKLVVLSACSTGLGKNVRGEGFIGLTRAFMYAGAQSTVASLWKVDDNATTELMRNFYSAMLNDGMSPPAALKAAKQKMWNHPRWRHPFYWAAFIIQGEYADSIKYEQHRLVSSVKVSILIGALIIVAVGFYLRNKLRRTLDRSNPRAQ